MKNLASFQNTVSKLDPKTMKSVKGGFSFDYEVMIDICYEDAHGNLNNIYCDRRRKRLGNSN